MGGYTDETLNRAKALRREMTVAERLLWKHLRGRQLAGAKFRKQQPIGPFIGDFVCQEKRLIVEADGGQHADSETDVQRTRFLESKGYRVIRFWNNEILQNIEGVLTAIMRVLESPHPPIAAQWAPPSPSRGEGFRSEHA
ncbi:MAG TPA: endonuclease domain-containing protein [Sphingomonadaceae bacterium]|nr:endonuclease domain-containing protein [Sphingomonadaceae bacterium]